MQIPIITGTRIEQGKNWPVYHKNEVCAKSNKAAQEVFKISGCDGECVEIVSESHCECPADMTELWVLGEKLLMN